MKVEKTNQKMRVETLEGKGPDETNIVNFLRDNAGLRIFPDGRKWEYLPGKVDGEMNFLPVGASVSSSIKPWESSRRLRDKLKPRLENVGIEDPDPFMEQIAEELNRAGREEYFLPEVEELEKGEREFEPENIPEIYQWEAESIIEDGNVLPEILKFYGQAHKGDYARILLLFLSSVSKKLIGSAINDYAVGTSGKGKSALARMMTRGVPNEHKLVRESISAKYLQYLTQKYSEDCLDGIVLFYDDVTVDEEKEVTLKAVADPLGDQVRHGTVIDQEVVDLTIKGKPVVWVNTVQAFKSAQLKNRFFIDQPDESSTLDREVADFQQKQIKKGILSPEEWLDYMIPKAIFKKLVESELSDLKVLIPFSWDWLYETDRRLQLVFGRLINVITKIHHPQRLRINKHNQSALLATPEDFYIAKLILNSFLVQTASKLTKRQIEVWKTLPPSETEIEDGKTRSEVEEEMQTSYGKVREDVSNLMEQGFATGEKVKNVWHYKKTQKKLVKSCVRYSKHCADFNGLKEEFKHTLRTCEISENAGRKYITSLWEKYKDNIFSQTFPQLTQLMKLNENELDSLLEVDHDCELASQLLTTCKQELREGSQASEKEENNIMDIADALKKLERVHLCEECLKLGLEHEAKERIDLHNPQAHRKSGSDMRSKVSEWPENALIVENGLRISRR